MTKMLFLTMFLREDISDGSGPGSVPTRGSVGVPLVNVKQIHNTTRPPTLPRVGTDPGLAN